VKRSGFDKALDGFSPGKILGALFLILLVAMFCLEVARVFTGPLNKNPLTSYGLYPGNIFYPPRFNLDTSFNIEREQHFVWPWSTPFLLFSLLPFLAGLFGVMSGRRGTYSMIYLFFTFSLLTLVAMPYIVAYYSINIHRYNNNGLDWTREVHLPNLTTLTKVITCYKFMSLVQR
jgi:hypothetical protein